MSLLWVDTTAGNWQISEIWLSGVSTKFWDVWRMNKTDCNWGQLLTAPWLHSSCGDLKKKKKKNQTRHMNFWVLGIKLWALRRLDCFETLRGQRGSLRDQREVEEKCFRQRREGISGSWLALPQSARRCRCMPFTCEFVTWRSWGALVLTYAVYEPAEEELSSLRVSCFKKKKDVFSEILSVKWIQNIFLFLHTETLSLIHPRCMIC